MSARSWKQYVATMCMAVWGLDVRATREVLRCVEDLLAAEGIPDSAAIQVFLSMAPSRQGVGRSDMIVRIRAPAGSSSSH